MSLSERLTTEKLDSYALACANVGAKLKELTDEGKHGHILMPSRGSYPFLWHARTYLKLEAEEYYGMGDFGSRWEAHLPLKCREIWLPFTAYSPDGNDIKSAHLRRYWCKVLKGILSAGEEPSAEFELHRFLTGEIFGQRTDHMEASANPSSGVIIIDTAISGRAVCEIAGALDQVGIGNFFFVVVIDEDGKRLRDEYRVILERLRDKGQAALYFVKDIFTEDSHHGLTGITSVVFPQLITRLSDMRAEPTAVGFWHIEVSRRDNNLNLPYTVTNAIVSNALYRRLRELAKENFREFESFSNKSERERIFELEQKDNVEDKTLARNFILPVIDREKLGGKISSIDITDSYIAVAKLKEDCVSEILARCSRL